jgi:hypothetical protein
MTMRKSGRLQPDDDGSIPLVDWYLAFEARIPIDDSTARREEAGRLWLKSINTDEFIEILWFDAYGRKHVGMPRDLWFPVYDSNADCLREGPFFGKGRALYKPRIRDRRHVPDKSADEIIAPTVSANEPAKLDEPDGEDEPIKPDDGHDESTAKSDEAGGHGKGDESSATDQWPWQQNLAIRANDGSELRRVQLECEERLEPSVQHLSPAKIQKALEKAGVKDTSESSIRRAFGHK